VHVPLLIASPERRAGGPSPVRFHLRRVALAALLALAHCAVAAADVPPEEERPIGGSVAIFARTAQDATMMALGNQSALHLKRVCNRLGRFFPVENNRLRAADRALTKRPADEDEYYRALAAVLKVDLYIVLSHYHVGPDIVGEMRIEPVSPNAAAQRRRVRVRSRILKNVPLKLGRELAYLHEGVPVRGRIVRRLGGDRYAVTIGQWHGVEKGRRYPSSVGEITLEETGRYESVARIAGDAARPGDPVVIDRPPDIRRITGELEETIARNAENRYGLRETQLHGEDDRKRLVEGLCVINLGGNVCLPGYGAYLSTGYMGFAEPVPDIPGIALSATVFAAQLTLPEFLTGWRVNFFPWEKDENKTPPVHSLQIYLWSAIPLTFSAAYLDQLAVQYKKFDRLPPFFMNHDEAAALFSLFIPGGGLFYKGYRLGGWSYFLSEMALVGYAVYWMNDDTGDRSARTNGAYALAAFGVIKAIELVNAYFISPSYTVYSVEMEREYRNAELYFDLRPEPEGRKGVTYRLGALYRM